MIEAQSLVKHFGAIRAVDGVSFTVAKGEVLGFLGPNGAGKSTTMKTLCGFLTPTSGQASICGHDIVAAPIEAKKRLGYLPEGAPAYSDMNPSSYLRFIAGIRGFDGAEAKKRIARAIELTNIASVLDQPMDTLSKGYKRRVGLAQALLHDPEVLVLDEPTDGLDPNQKHEVRALIGEMAPHKAIIISTHILEEVSAVCTRALIIDAGKIVADGTPLELEQRSQYHNAVTLTLDARAVAKTAEALKAHDSVERVEIVDPSRITVFPKEGKSIVAEIGRLARAKKWPLEEIHAERGRLDEVFRQITQSAA
ncbi:MAG: ATP-binding cassette domain-containing protein [Alphaproteobacteria bacterium]|nr:ATP-binding cassette domain-containing protein [Alphaproteobacteria bacterium]